MPLGAYNYFGGLFGKEVWEDGQGMDQVREFYAPSHIPFSFSHFVKQAAICDPNLADECRKTRCEIPEGGRGTLPGFSFFKWGFKTHRDCIANIRSIRQFRYWAEKIIEDRERVDEAVMNMFYTMAAIQTSGNKVTMQGVRGADGLLRLANSNDPRNPMRGGLFNYMEEKFPAPNNLQDIVPLTVDSMEELARYWSQFPLGNEAATGSRGEKIWEFWYPDDWYMAEAIRNPDYMEKLKILMPNHLFSGNSLAPGDREVVGNFAAKVMPWLPRFAPTADGKIVPVDTHVGVDIEVGKEYVGSLDFQNAPYGLAMTVSGKQGTILTRPPLTTSGAGFPIDPIVGNGPWKIWNDYDKECNPEKNQPYSTKDYEMGFRMDSPTAALSMLFRRRVFLRRPVNECDLAPIFTTDDNNVNCPLTTIGCGDNQRRENNDITQASGPTYVECFAKACGNTLVSPFLYTLKVKRIANQPDYNSLTCDCGSGVKLFVYDANGVFSREILGTYVSSENSFPEARYLVKTTVALASGECIKGVSCADSTRLAGNAIDLWDVTNEDGEIIAGQVGFYLDDSLGGCSLTDDVKVRYYNKDGAVLGTINGVISALDISRFYYKITSTNPAFKAEAYVGQVSVGVSCAEAGNASSSSSGD